MAPVRAAVRLAFVPVALVLVPLLTGCDRDNPAPAARASVPPSGGPAVATELAVVAVRPGADLEGTFQGYLEPAVDAVVPARTAGILRQVYVKEGDRVARGAALARLEDDEHRLEVEYTGALAEQAAAELDRAERGAAGEFVSRQQLDVARAKARATKADLELARLALARRTLRAPIAGVVWQVRARPWRMVAPDDILFRVSDLSRLRADLWLPAAMLGRVKKGDPVRLVPLNDAHTGDLAARVVTTSPIVDPATGRLRVEVETTGADRSLAGQTVAAVFGDAASRPEALSRGVAAAILPREALIERDDMGLHVWRVKDGVARRIAVELGAGGPDGFEVTRGLAAGDLVATRGSLPPADGATVRARLATTRTD